MIWEIERFGLDDTGAEIMRQFWRLKEEQRNRIRYAMVVYSQCIGNITIKDEKWPDSVEYAEIKWKLKQLQKNQ